MAAKQRTIDDLIADNAPTKRSIPTGARVIDGAIITEPLGAGVRVTARDSKDRLLWGYVAGQISLDAPHVLVATYETLRQQVIGELPSYVDSHAGTPATKQCLDALAAITVMLDRVRERLSPKAISDKTEKRATECLPALRDIVTLITYELTDRRPTAAADSGE